MGMTERDIMEAKASPPVWVVNVSSHPAAGKVPTPEGASAADLTAGKEALEFQIKISSTWALMAVATQLMVSTYLWYTASFLYLIIHTLFVIMGISGLQMRSKCLVFTHFVYTFFFTFSILYMVATTALNADDMFLYVLSFMFTFLLIQSFGMRNERTLIALYPLAEEVSRMESTMIPTTTAAHSKSFESDCKGDSECEGETQSLMYPAEQYAHEYARTPSPLHEIDEFVGSSGNGSVGVGVVPPLYIHPAHAHALALAQAHAQYEYGYPPTPLPQYPMMLPSQFPGQQQQFVVLPYQGFSEQERFPMMYYHPSPSPSVFGGVGGVSGVPPTQTHPPMSPPTPAPAHLTVTEK